MALPSQFWIWAIAPEVHKMADLMEKAIAVNGHFRAVAAITTRVVEALRKRHDLSPGASVALGRAITGAFLLASELKGDERVMVQIIGEGALGEIVAEASPSGEGRGYVKNPRAEVPISDGKIQLSQALYPPGTVTVIKDLGLREPYRGVAPLVSGEIGKDLANYLWISEQIPSAVALGVYIEADLSVGAAGGYLVQTMPGATDEEIELVEKNILQLPAPTELIRSGNTPRQMVEEVLRGHELKWLGSQRLRFKCRCSKGRIAEALVALGEKELEDLIFKEGEVEITCEFCRKEYHFSREELQNLLWRAVKRGKTPDNQDERRN